MSGNAGGRQALAFTTASFAAAALNYLFQIHAVNVLDGPSFGLLSAWLARVGVAGVVATVVQFVSLDHRLPARSWSALTRAVGAGSLAVIAAHVVFGTHAPELVLTVTVVAGGIVLYALTGQLQARLELGTIASRSSPRP